MMNISNRTIQSNQKTVNRDITAYQRSRILPTKQDNRSQVIKSKPVDTSLAVKNKNISSTTQTEAVPNTKQIKTADEILGTIVDTEA